MTRFDDLLKNAFMAGFKHKHLTFNPKEAEDAFVDWRKCAFALPDEEPELRVRTEAERRREFREIVGDAEDAADLNRYEGGMGL